MMSERYRVEKTIMESYCEHEKCEQLHQRFMNEKDINTGKWFHMTKRTEWMVVDAETEGCAYLGTSKKDCVAFAKRWNTHEATRR